MSFYDDASLIMFPSGYKEDKIYSLKPTDGSGDLTFTRASTATRVNADGLIETSPVNLFTYSEDFTNADWTKINATITANTTTAPNGTLTGDTLIPSLASSNAIYQTISSSGVMSLSLYAKANTSNFVFIDIFDISPAVDYLAIFDLSNGTYVGNGGYSNVDSYSIQSVGNGWYRISATKDLGAVGNHNYSAGVANGNSAIPVANTSVFVWGAQLNSGATAKPYFPTTDRLNVPRIDYTGGGCGSLLLEPQRTNLISYSNDLANAWYSIFNATSTANSAISPDGTQNATLVSFDANAAARVEKALGGTYESQTHTISVYAKVASGTAQFRLKCTHAGVVDYLSNDFAVTTEWQRFTFTQAFGSTVGSGIVGGVTNSSGGTAQNILFYGFQLEANSSYATSLILTTGASVTRLADAAYKTGISSLIGQTEGTVFVDFVMLNNASDMVPFNINGSDGKLIWIRNSGLQFYGNGTTLLANIGAGDVTVQGTRYKIGFVYGQNDFRVYRNGSLIGTDTSGTFTGTFSDIALNSVINQANAFSQVVLFKTKLTNTQLASLTTL